MDPSARPIEVACTTEDIRRAYNFRSYFYDWLVAPMLRKPVALALQNAAIHPGDRVLEVAVGPGHTLLNLAHRVGPRGTVCGVDLSPRMLEVAARRLRQAGFTRVDLREADARRLPFPDNQFDAVYNGYMLDLTPASDMPRVLAEFHRVLAPGGRLVLVNVSKRDHRQQTWRERGYQLLPGSWAPYVLGGSRPVFMGDLVRQAGFINVRRDYLEHVVSSEIVTAVKPLVAS